MKRILKEVQEGKFAKEWIDEAKSGGKNFKAMKERTRTTASKSSAASSAS